MSDKRLHNDKLSIFYVMLPAAASATCKESSVGNQLLNETLEPIMLGEVGAG